MPRRLARLMAFGSPNSNNVAVVASQVVRKLKVRIKFAFQCSPRPSLTKGSAAVIRSLPLPQEQFFVNFHFFVRLAEPPGTVEFDMRTRDHYGNFRDKVSLSRGTA